MNKRIIIFLILFFFPIGVFSAYEDFSTYTEADANSRLTVTSSKVTWTNFSRYDTDHYVYKDYGSNHFNGDFEHLLSMQITGYSGDYGYAGAWAMANVVDDWSGLQGASESGLFVHQQHNTGTANAMACREVDSGSYYDSSYYSISLNTYYYLKIKRDESVGTYGTLYTYIYSDSSRTTLLTTLSVALHSNKKDFRYLYGFQGGGWSDLSGRLISGFSENLDIQESSPAPTTEERILHHSQMLIY